MAVPLSMTTSQMIDFFLIEYDRIVAKVSQSYTDDQILSFLNRSQEKIVSELAKARRYDLLGPLYVINSSAMVPVAATSIGIPNGYYLLKSDPLFDQGVFEFGDISVASTRINLPAGNDTVMAEWIDNITAHRFIKDLSNAQMLFRAPKIYVDGNYLIILVDAFTSAVPAVYTRYVKYPMNLVILPTLAVAKESTYTSELPANLHRSLVTQAVYLAKEATDRVQPQKQEE